MMLSVATQSCPSVLPPPKSVCFHPSVCLVRGRNLVEIWWTVADIYKAPITPEPWSVFLGVSEHWPDNLVGRWVILFCFAQISHYRVKYPPNWHQPAGDSKQHFLTMNTEKFSLKNLYFLPKHARLLHSHPRCFAILCQPTKLCIVNVSTTSCQWTQQRYVTEYIWGLGTGYQDIYTFTEWLNHGVIYGWALKSNFV